MDVSPVVPSSATVVGVLAVGAEADAVGTALWFAGGSGASRRACIASNSVCNLSCPVCNQPIIVVSPSSHESAPASTAGTATLRPPCPAPLDAYHRSGTRRLTVPVTEPALAETADIARSRHSRGDPSSLTSTPPEMRRQSRKSKRYRRKNNSCIQSSPKANDSSTLNLPTATIHDSNIKRREQFLNI